MVQSMTGYGTAQAKVGGRRIVVETKSVNHKFCEVNLRLPPRFSFLEGKIVELAKSFFSRGRIDLFLKEEASTELGPAARINIPALQAYYREIQKAARALKISSTIQMDTLLGLPQVLLIEEEKDVEALWSSLRKLLSQSFKALEKARQKEGDAIARFLKKELRVLEQEVKSIEALLPQNIENYRQQLSERIAKLSGGIELDPQRLIQEVAYFVDRTDVSEELHRLTQHIQHFFDILQESAPLGRKLDFLLQEMNRETNTLSAKAQNAVISQKVVFCKHCLEKLREQVQNLE